MISELFYRSYRELKEDIASLLVELKANSLFACSTFGFISLLSSFIFLHQLLEKQMNDTAQCYIQRSHTTKTQYDDTTEEQCALLF